MAAKDGASLVLTLVPLAFIVLAQLVLSLCSLVEADGQAAFETGAVVVVGIATMRKTSASLSALYGLACSSALLCTLYRLDVVRSFLDGLLEAAIGKGSKLLRWMAFAKAPRVEAWLLPSGWSVEVGASPPLPITAAHHAVAPVAMVTAAILLHLAGMLLGTRLHLEISALEGRTQSAKPGMSALQPTKEEEEEPWLTPSLPCTDSSGASFSSSNCVAPRRPPMEQLPYASAWNTCWKQRARAAHDADAAAGSLWTPPPCEVPCSSVNQHSATSSGCHGRYYTRRPKEERHLGGGEAERKKPAPFRAILSAHVESSLRSHHQPHTLPPTVPRQEPASAQHRDGAADSDGAARIPALDFAGLRPPPLRQPEWPPWRPNALRPCAATASSSDEDEEKGSVL